MGFVAAIKSGFRNRINYSGRSTRSEFWFWNLFVVLFSIALFFVWGNILDRFLPKKAEDIAFLVALLIILAVTLPGFAVMARRLHDLGRRGWWGLVFLIPLLGQIVFLVWMLMRGTRGANRFGEDPLTAKTSFVAAAA